MSNIHNNAGLNPSYRYDKSRIASKHVRDTMIAIRTRINDFEYDECGTEQYTDTGDMWNLIYTIREMVEDHIGKAE